MVRAPIKVIFVGSSLTEYVVPGGFVGGPRELSRQHSMEIDEQWECRTLCAINMKMKARVRGGEETTPVTTAFVYMRSLRVNKP